jgi:hypothetical protein
MVFNYVCNLKENEFWSPEPCKLCQCLYGSTRCFKSDCSKSGYLNSEIDQQIKRGVIPKNIQRPYVKNDRILLPQYGIKEFKDGGQINNWTEKYKN